MIWMRTEVRVRAEPLPCPMLEGTQWFDRKTKEWKPCDIENPWLYMLDMLCWDEPVEMDTSKI